MSVKEEKKSLENWVLGFFNIYCLERDKIVSKDIEIKLVVKDKENLKSMMF